MIWDIPNWYAALLLALAAYRVFHLLAHDQILDPIRQRLVRPDTVREDFLECPYCSGAWVTIIVWLAWVWQPHWTLVVATPFAISAVVALIATFGDD